MAFDPTMDGTQGVPKSLEDIFSDAGVDSVLGNSLISDGWTTKTFALSANWIHFNRIV